jgi:chemotaxis protein CheX
MSNSIAITELLTETILATKSVIPIPYTVGEAGFVKAPILPPEIAVLVGITGDFRCRLLLVGTFSIFQKFGESMFNMMLEGEMLESFAGEIGNMIVGNLATNISKQNIYMDITPPTVLVGQTKISGFKKAQSIVLCFETGAELEIMLILEEN